MNSRTDSPTESRWANWIFALLFGIAGSVAIAAFPHWYEIIVRQDTTEQALATALPPMVFFLIFILVALVNPVLVRWCPGLQLRAAEMATVISMWLATATVCFSGGLSYVLHLIGNLRTSGLESAAFQRSGVLGFLKPEWALNAEEAGKYFLGISFDGSQTDFSNIPWAQWAGPLSFWLPLFVLTIVMAFALVGICHHQWSQNEKLCYPLAEFTGAFIVRDEQRPFPNVFYDRSFWAGFILVSLIMITNGLNAWFPVFIAIPLSFAHYDLISHFPFLSNYCGREAYSLFRGFLYPFVIALAVLLPLEISFSCSVGWILMVLGTGVYFLLTSQALGPTETGVIQYGMFWGVLGMILLIGREYYTRVLIHALTLRKPAGEGMGAAVVSCRVFLVSFALMVLVLVSQGMPVSLGLLVTATFALVVLVAARLTAEVGVPWLVNLNAVSSVFPLYFLGSAAASKQGLVVLAVVSSVLGKNMGNSVAAQSTTIQQLGSQFSRPGRMVAALVLGVGIALAVSPAMTLWNNYSHGSKNETRNLSSLRSDLEGAGDKIERLQIATSGATAPAFQPVSRFWPHFLGGFAAIIVCALLRLRFAWWPFHPLPFIFLNSWCMSRLYLSFLVGWLIKLAILKIAGGNFYLKAKPFFFGIIAGQLVCVFFWCLIGAIFYLVTGLHPPGNRLLF